MQTKRLQSYWAHFMRWRTALSLDMFWAEAEAELRECRQRDRARGAEIERDNYRRLIGR
jgi:hypothetical protein